MGTGLTCLDNFIAYPARKWNVDQGVAVDMADFAFAKPKFGAAELMRQRFDARQGCQGVLNCFVCVENHRFAPLDQLFPGIYGSVWASALQLNDRTEFTVHDFY